MYARSINLISKIAASGNIPHTLLFSGPDSAGKKNVAMSFAKWLLHENPEEFDASDCDCNLCAQVDSFSHPDFYLLDTSPIKIKEVRDLRRRFSLAPFYAKRKVAVIDNAEALGKEAANAFLKTIEEPRGDSIFIFLAKSRKSLLPTIASRAFEIRFAPKAVSAKQDIAQRVDDFEKMNLHGKFLEAQKYNLKNREELSDFLDAWLIKLRANLIGPSLGLKETSLARDILSVKKIISTTNANPGLLMEQLCVTHYL